MIPDPSKWVETSDGWDTDKHYEERKVQGFSKADWINFDTYIAWVIANAVQKMKDEGHTMFSYPGEPVENWEHLTRGEYDVMIKGFGRWAEGDEALLELSPEEYRDASAQMVSDLEDALEIFKNRFKSLWD